MTSRERGAEPAGNTLPLAKREVPREFDRVAARYDLLTSLNPGYRRHLRMSVRRLALPAGSRVLDLCCGTGRSTVAILHERPEAKIVALDASAGMLTVARRRINASCAHFVQGDAMDPEAAGVRGPFDAIFMAYGIRNMPDADACLDRILRLLKPGGRVCLHEYALRDSSLCRLVWNLVTLGVIIPGGFLASGTTRLFRYLRRSVLEFDTAEEFERRLVRSGFEAVRTDSVDGWQRGIVHSFVARRPLDA